jgi:hypothetical protein
MADIKWMAAVAAALCVGLTLGCAGSDGAGPGGPGKMAPGRDPGLDAAQVVAEGERLRAEYVRGLRRILAGEHLPPDAEARVLVLLGRAGDREAITRIAREFRRSYVADDWERTAIWGAAAQDIVFDKAVVRKLCSSKDEAARLAGTIIASVFVDDEWPALLRRMLNDKTETRPVKASAILALAANRSWADLPFFVRLAESNEAPSWARTQARWALAIYIGKEGELSADEFRKELRSRLNGSD